MSMEKAGIVGKDCIAASDAPFTDEQKMRLGTVLHEDGMLVHVEWQDKYGWKTKAWLPREWIYVSGVVS